MRARRGIAVALCALSMLLFSGATVYHTGGTDSNGGHWNHSTGEYHYHHGYPEHQHTNGVCPYDFVDKSGQNSGSSGGGKSDWEKVKEKAKEDRRVKEIKVNNAPEQLNEGQIYHLKWQLNPTYAEYEHVEWSSSDESIATITSSGKITAIEEGTVRLEGRIVSGVSTSFRVEVKHIKTTREKFWDVAGAVLGIGVVVFFVPIVGGLFELVATIVEKVQKRKNRK